MSIAAQIARLQNDKSLIQSALVNKGIESASTHNMDDFANDINNIKSAEYTIKTGSFDSIQGNTKTIDIGFKPDYVEVYNTLCDYTYIAKEISGTAANQSYNLTNTAGNRTANGFIKTITDTGFTFLQYAAATYNGTYYYIAFKKN